jgi:hypothetical protein
MTPGGVSSSWIGKFPVFELAPIKRRDRLFRRTWLGTVFAIAGLQQEPAVSVDRVVFRTAATVGAFRIYIPAAWLRQLERFGSKTVSALR